MYLQYMMFMFILGSGYIYIIQLPSFFSSYFLVEYKHYMSLTRAKNNNNGNENWERGFRSRRFPFSKENSERSRNFEAKILLHVAVHPAEAERSVEEHVWAVWTLRLDPVTGSHEVSFIKSALCAFFSTLKF